MKNRFNENGACRLCSGGWLCIHCQADNAARDRAQGEMFRRASGGIRAQRIARVCASLELESDEGGTREEKAEKLIESY